MRTSPDAPAAFPLIAYAAGLIAGSALGCSYVEPIAVTVIAMLVVGLRRIGLAMLCLALAGGVCVATHARRLELRTAAAVARLPSDRFVTIVAPIDHDWCIRGDAHVLRSPRFVAEGVAIDKPLTIYTRFEPPLINMERSIRAEGFLRTNERGDAVVSVKAARLMSYEGSASWLAPSTWNRAVANRIRPFAEAQPTEVALVEALALGRGERLTDEVRDSYKQGGTYHLLVFSGLQIALGAGLLALLLRWLQAPRASDWSLLILAIAAPLFIGPTASVSRASTAIGLYAISRILHRPTTLENLWCVAVLARLILVPHDLVDPAFHLTYAGAGALLFAGKSLATARTRWLSYAAAAEVSITPLTLFHFHQYALGGSLMTMLLMPVVFVMLITSIAVCAMPSVALLSAVGMLHRLCALLNAIGAPLWGFFAAPPLACLAIGYGAAMSSIALCTGRLRGAAIVAAMTIPLVGAFVVSRRDVPTARLTMLDVGQGDALLLRTTGHVVLVDAGGRLADSHFGTTELLPMLLDRGVRHIDVAVLTHVHPDHCGGLPAVLENIGVDQLWISPRRFRGDCAQRVLEACSRRSIPIHLVRDGSEKMVGEIGLHAYLPDRTFKHSPENNSSVVLRARIGKWTALLTGDAERDAEDMLADRDIRADILKVGHHGSRTSSSARLLDAVHPRIALISCGLHNTFGHPHASVVESLRERSIHTWRTDRHGTIDLDLASAHIFVHSQFDTPR